MRSRGVSKIREDEGSDWNASTQQSLAGGTTLPILGSTTSSHSVTKFCHKWYPRSRQTIVGLLCCFFIFYFNLRDVSNPSPLQPFQYNITNLLDIPPMIREPSRLALLDSSTILIPHNIIFVDTRYSKPQQLPKLFFDNIQKTTRQYRKLWEDGTGTDDDIQQHSSTSPVLWFGNDKCLEVIEKVYPMLIRYYKSEKKGRYKSNMCRIAALYYHGGYYFDTDMESIQPVPLDNQFQHYHDISFCSVYEHAKNGLFNSFVAAIPRHPILKTTLDVMLAYYQGRIEIRTTNMGTSTLLDGLIHTPSKARGKVLLLQEVYLVQDSLLSPMIPRRTGTVGTGNGCDYVVRGEDLTLYFYSRMVGSSTFCNFKNQYDDTQSWLWSLLAKTKSPAQFRESY